MSAASCAPGDGGAAGGVIGGGALGDVGGEGAAGGRGDVGDGDGERAMVMLALPMRGDVTQRVVAVGYAPGGGGAGGFVGEGAAGRWPNR